MAAVKETIDTVAKLEAAARLRYGTLPVVRRTGGLADRVKQETGLLFDDPEPFALQGALQSLADDGSLKAIADKYGLNAGLY